MALCFHLVRLLPVEPVSNVEDGLENLNNILGHLLGDRSAVSDQLISIGPSQDQALLQS